MELLRWESTVREGQLWWPRPHEQSEAALRRLIAALAAEERVVRAALIACRTYGEPNSAQLVLDLHVERPARWLGWLPGALRQVGIWWASLRLAYRLRRRLAADRLRISVACESVRVMPIAWEFLWRDGASRAASWGQLQPVLAQPQALIYRRPGRGRRAG
jgi:hypothetical protein